MAKSVKVNFVFNLINTISGLLFPLITFPYATRIMLADGIGQVNFFSSIISYITLFTSIGIPMYAIREIARVRDDKVQMNRTALEILFLNLMLVFLGYVVVFVLCITVSEIYANIILFLILSSSILLTAIGCEWFYQGIEDFKYITIRNILLKFLFVVLLFAFVKEKDDLLIYGLLTILGTVGNNLFNFVRLRKYLTIATISYKDVHPLRHLKPSLKIFALNLIVSLYINLNSVMLGFMKDVTVVGYYTAASKIAHILLGIAGSLQAVMIPRLSNLVQAGKADEFKALSQKAVDFVVALSMPVMVGLFFMAPIFISLLCGDAFMPAVNSLRIMSPIILAIGLSGLLGIQILYPQGKENVVIVSTAVGAIINIVFNIILIPKFSCDGAAIATVLAEIGVTITLVIIGRKYLPIEYISKHYVNCIIGSLFMGVICHLLVSLEWELFISITVIPLFCATIYGICLLVMKDSFALYLIKMTKSKLKN